MGKTLANFKMDDYELQKAKYVAWYERTSLTALITSNLKERISQFEKENGEITDDMIKKMEDSK